MRTVLKAICDPDRDKLKAFSKKWGVDDAFTSLEEMIESQRIDIISICSPTERHFEHLNSLLLKTSLQSLLKSPFQMTLMKQRL